MDLLDRLRVWVDNQIAGGDPTRPSNSSLLALHLEGIGESGADIINRIEDALASSDSGALDHLLTDLRIYIEHLNGHWKSLNHELGHDMRGYCRLFRLINPFSWSREIRKLRR